MPFRGRDVPPVKCQCLVVGLHCDHHDLPPSWTRAESQGRKRGVVEGRSIANVICICVSPEELGATGVVAPSIV